MNDIVPIQQFIFEIRGQRVMLDRDLAMLYGVETKVLNQAVKRNIDRFPPDFMFTLKVSEYQDVVTNCDRFASLKHSTVMPHAFKTTSKKFLQTKTTSAKKTAHSLNS